MKTNPLTIHTTTSKRDVVAFVPVKKRSGRKRVVIQKPKKTKVSKPAHRKKDTLVPGFSPDGSPGSGRDNEHAELEWEGSYASG